MTKKGLIIVGGLLLANLVVFGALAYLILSSSGSSLVSPLSPASQLTAATGEAETDGGATAKGLYPVAMEVATAWQSDARLVSASADWPGPTAENLEDQEVPWSFNFYSPAARKVYAVVVSGGQARGVRENQVPRDLNPAPVEGWQIDSPAASGHLAGQRGPRFPGPVPAGPGERSVAFPFRQPQSLMDGAGPGRAEFCPFHGQNRCHQWYHH